MLAARVEQKNEPKGRVKAGCADGQDTRAVQHYLGYKNIQPTVRDTELLPERFKSFWDD